MAEFQCSVMFTGRTVEIRDKGFHPCTISKSFEAALVELADQEPFQNSGRWTIDGESEVPTSLLVLNPDVYARIYLADEELAPATRTEMIAKTEEPLLRVLERYFDELLDLQPTPESTGEEYPKENSERPWLD